MNESEYLNLNAVDLLILKILWVLMSSEKKQFIADLWCTPICTKYVCTYVLYKILNLQTKKQLIFHTFAACSACLNRF